MAKDRMMATELKSTEFHDISKRLAEEGCPNVVQALIEGDLDAAYDGVRRAVSSLDEQRAVLVGCLVRIEDIRGVPRVE